MPEVTEVPRNHNPLPSTGVSRNVHRVPRYDDLQEMLLDMLAEQVDKRPGSEWGDPRR